MSNSSDLGLQNFAPDPDDCVIDVRPKTPASRTSETIFAFEVIDDTSSSTQGTRFHVTVPASDAIYLFDGSGAALKINKSASHPHDHMQANKAYQIIVGWTGAPDVRKYTLEVHLVGQDGSLTELYKKETLKRGPTDFFGDKRPVLTPTTPVDNRLGWRLTTESRKVQMDIFLTSEKKL